jgi:hypothetical protein
MFEKNEKDFIIYDNHDKTDYNGKSRLFSLCIGTWSNSNLTIPDLMFYLTLSNKEKEKSFLEELKLYKKLITPKTIKESIKEIKTDGINYNSILGDYGFNNLYDLLNGEDNGETENVLSVKKYKEFLKQYNKKMIKILKSSSNIIILYHDLQQLKKEIKEDIYDNIEGFLE